MLASDVLNRVRRTLNDETSASYRWTDAVLFRYLNDGIQEVISRRPDTKMDDAGLLQDFPTVTGTSDPINLQADLTEPLADYVCYRALAEDQSDTMNANLAQGHLERFRQELYGQ